MANLFSDKTDGQRKQEPWGESAASVSVAGQSSARVSGQNGAGAASSSTPANEAAEGASNAGTNSRPAVDPALALIPSAVPAEERSRKQQVLQVGSSVMSVGDSDVSGGVSSAAPRSDRVRQSATYVSGVNGEAQYHALPTDAVGAQGVLGRLSSLSDPAAMATAVRGEHGVGGGRITRKLSTCRDGLWSDGHG